YEIEGNEEAEHRLDMSIQNSRWRWIIVGAVLAIAIVAVVLTSFKPSSSVPLTNLNHVEELRTRFNQDMSKVRILLLLSPT
ncbi:MAG TPA: hypothetical protein VMS31_23035, partial [Pyrinomonadaceae bacterium]|nr:hypothetical protein [Pyrinomonadaceae bacterium]